MWFSVVLRSVLASFSLAAGGAAARLGDEARFAIYMAAAGTVFLGYLVLEYRAVIRPALHVSRVRNPVLRVLATQLLAHIQQQGVTPRMNLQVPFRPLRWLWCRRFFKILWFQGMENHPDVNLELPIRCGVVGECFRTKRPAVVGPQQLRNLLPNLPDKARSLVQDLQAVICFPVYEPPRRSGRQSGRLLGVLCLDSKTANAFAVLAAPPTFDVIQERMDELSRIAALFAVR